MLFKVICTLSGRERTLPFEAVSSGGAVVVTVKKAAIPAETRRIDVICEEMCAHFGTNGYIACSGGPSDGDFLCGFVPREDGEWAFEHPMMPLFGLKKDGFCVAAMALSGNLEMRPVVRAEDGVYSVFARFEPEQAMYEDIVVRYVPLFGGDADYSGMARAYRACRLERGDVVPLRERAKASPGLAHAMNTVYIRIRQGWKPAPSPVPEQTPETEPPMHAAVTFDRAANLLDEMKKRGVNDADICLVGWNRKGHDGRYPQLFPVEPELGGEERLRALIAHARALGYAIDCHTNSTDAYRVADCFDENEIMRNADGGMAVDPNAWSAGRMYHLCGVPALKRAEDDLPKVAALGFSSLHYIDVIGSEWPRDCFSPLHPQTKRDTANSWNALLSLSRKLFGGACCEGCFDCFAPTQDYGLFESRNLLGELPEIAERRVPLWALVYHGIIMGNPSGETLNYAAKGPRERLKCHEYGGRPSVYVHQAFTGEHWRENRAFCCDTDEALAACVRDIARTAADYEAVKHLQSLFMEKHELIAPDVARVVYEDGEEMICNDSDADFPYRGETVPAHDFRLFK